MESIRMKSIRAGVLAMAVAVASLSGCMTTGGAVVGGIAGHKMGGDTASTVGGAVLGGMIGSQIGK
jgi:osmotically inducible lipoprotein OsmB